MNPIKEMEKDMNFADAIKNTQVESRTDNGMNTFESSCNYNVDLFFLIGASRKKDITADFEKAYQENPELALRMLMWVRDIRGGAGERQTFRDLLLYLEEFHQNVAMQLVPFISEFGRWDDILIFKTSELKNIAFMEVAKALSNENKLCAKWMPRKGQVSIELRNFLKLSPKSYRKLLVNLTDVVEQKMCSNKWNEIDFSNLPSIAAARYQSAFNRHAQLKYEEYKERLINGESKINVSTLFPHDVLRSIRGGDKEVATVQWESLKNYVKPGKILPVVDVSGSMDFRVSGTISALDVAISLGLYISDKNIGAFKDCVLTFSGDSRIEILKGNIVEKLNQIQCMHWSMSTNLHSAFDAILSVAEQNKLRQEDTPEYLLILSDMEFNKCVDNDDTAMRMIKIKYENSGYNLPSVIFWNLKGRSGNTPVKYSEEKTALISGFSPAILQKVLEADNISPEAIMLEALMVDRYNFIEAIEK